VKRYKNAYVVARVTNGFGETIKATGIIIAILLLIVGVMFLSNGHAGDATFALGSLNLPLNNSFIGSLQ
jgi:uncharacterized membrane protein